MLNSTKIDRLYNTALQASLSRFYYNLDIKKIIKIKIKNASYHWEYR
jgi:hypothetical protein